MSDDTNVLTEWLEGGVSESRAGRMYKRALDTIKRLERDRDALAERCEKLREALRVCMIVEADRHRESDGPKMQCIECRKWWNADDPERHAEGCLAA